MFSLADGADLIYVLDKTGVITTNVTAEINTSYNISGSRAIELPDAITSPTGSVVVFKQLAGSDSIITDITSQDINERNPSKVTTVYSGTTKSFFLARVLGRKVWYQISGVKDISGSATPTYVAAVIAETNAVVAETIVMTRDDLVALINAEVSTRTDAILSETTNRVSADVIEANARVAAIQAEADARIAAITAESSARISSDQATATLDATQAPINSPTFTGAPTAPTPSLGDTTTRLANTLFTQQTIDAQTVKYNGAQTLTNTQQQQVVVNMGGEQLNRYAWNSQPDLFPAPAGVSTPVYNDIVAAHTAGKVSRLRNGLDGIAAIGTGTYGNAATKYNEYDLGPADISNFGYTAQTYQMCPVNTGVAYTIVWDATKNGFTTANGAWMTPLTLPAIQPNNTEFFIRVGSSTAISVAITGTDLKTPVTLTNGTGSGGTGDWIRFVSNGTTWIFDRTSGAGHNTDGDGLSINVPANTAIAWVRVLGDRFDAFRAYFYTNQTNAKTVDSTKDLGYYASGYDFSHPVSPDNIHDNREHESQHCWFPIPIPPSMQATGGKLAIIHKGNPAFVSGGNSSLAISGVAFTANPLGYSKLNAISMHWSVMPYPGRTQLIAGVNGNTTGSGITWGATSNYSQYVALSHLTVPGVFMMPVVDTGKDKEFIFCHYGHDSRGGTPVAQVTVEGTVLTGRPVYRRNRLTDLHPNTAGFRWFSIKVPASLTVNKIWLQCQILATLTAQGYVAQLHMIDWEN